MDAKTEELRAAHASLAGVACWYSLIYLAPADRTAAFGELARVLKPGGYLVTAFKAGDSQVRRGGSSTGVRGHEKVALAHFPGSGADSVIGLAGDDVGGSSTGRRQCGGPGAAAGLWPLKY